MIDDLCRAIIERADITTFVETGTYQGETVSLVSQWFSELWPEEFGTVSHLGVVQDEKGPNPWNTRITFPIFARMGTGARQIYSIELDNARAERVGARYLGNSCVHIIEGSSETVLRNVVEAEGDLHRCFFYLDAHWNDYWPLKDELEQIQRLKKFICVIDDFHVPFTLGWGYDVHGGVECGWGLIWPFVDSNNISAYYPLRSNRDNRGWVLLFKGYSKEEQDQILAGLPFESHLSNYVVR